MNSTYALRLRTGVQAHYTQAVSILGDYADRHDSYIDVLARSGDYLITLATKLESIAADLPETSTTASSLALLKLAKELDYLQRHYSLVRKARPDRLREL